MLTPLEIHSKQFKAKFGRYDAREVDEFFDMVGQSYDQLYRENAELKERVRQLSEKEKESSDIGDMLKETLVMAQKAAEDARRSAEDRAKLVVEAAEREAATIFDRMEDRVRTQEKRLEDLLSQEGTVRARMRAMLEAYLEMLDESGKDYGMRQSAAARE